MKVLIIDEQRLFADGIRYLLKKHDPKIRTHYVSNNLSAYECIKSTEPPDLMFLNVNDDDPKNSYELIHRLNRLNLYIPLIVVSANATHESAALAIENNASGFITKNCSRKVILEAISSVLSGNVFISQLKHNDFVHKQDHKEVAEISITARQQEVLYLLSQGLLNKQIASELDISANTVKAHLHDLFKSLEVTNRTAAVQSAHRYGLI